MQPLCVATGSDCGAISRTVGKVGLGAAWNWGGAGCSGHICRYVDGSPYAGGWLCTRFGEDRLKDQAGSRGVLRAT